jgi:hypothetical protein
VIAVPLFALILAAAGPAAPPLAPSPAPLPSAASPAPPPALAAPPPASPAQPRHIDDLDRPLLGAVPQGTYEAGVKGAFSRAENLQGPLDGAWVLSEAGGQGIYRFQLNDPGYRGGPVQGAFQDLSAQGALGASGFFDGVVREGNSLTFNFEARGERTVVALEVRPGGTYAGKMTRGGISREVSLARP